jgi:hypothetical protein
VSSFAFTISLLHVANSIHQHIDGDEPPRSRSESSTSRSPQEKGLVSDEPLVSEKLMVGTSRMEKHEKAVQYFEHRG